MDFYPSSDPFASVEPSSNQGYQPPIFDGNFGGQDPFTSPPVGYSSSLPQEITEEEKDELERQAQRDLENKERQKRLMAKDAKEMEQKEQKRQQARSDLKKFYEDRNKAIDVRRQLNLTKENELKNNKASYNDSTSWKKVASMIDFKDTDRKDQARMKSVLLAKKHESN
ncbi:hypothetical protein SteCoe_18188 [Stentor coeruleus]|uniref:Clathrin light chain n=1 Tax=Stentor coeruleus TaxID=5963 RepID=A0A1R2BX55_9CILI|nr:hypothetical protein SteCoe_18188 [Stentor coeruleus]